MLDASLLTLKQIYKSRKAYILEFFLFLPLVLGIYSIYRGENGTEVFSDITYRLYLQLFVLFVTLIFATSLVNDDIQSGKIVFLITRIQRTRIVAEKYLGYLVSTFMVFLVPLISMFAALRLYAPEPIPFRIFFSYILILLMAIATYGAVYFLVSIVISRPLMFGLFFAFIWEMLAPALSERISKITVTHYLQSITYHTVDYGEIQMMANPSSIAYALTALIGTCIVMLSLSTIIFKHKSIE